MPASAGPSESYFTSAINRERTSRGIRAYAVRGDLTTVARRHAARMAASRSYYHNPNLGSEVSGWDAVGENVGKGSSASALHQAFMSSSGHRRNILSTSFTEVGVGTATDPSGTLYVVQVFRRPSGAPAYQAPARASTSTTTSRTPSRASRGSTRAPRPAMTAAVAPRVHPALLLRARVRTAGAWAYRTNRTGTLPRLIAFHRVVRITSG